MIAEGLAAALFAGPFGCEIVVEGTPGPQGSKRTAPLGGKSGSSATVVIESSKKVKPWRRAVMAAAAAAGHRRGAPTYDGPLIASVVFTMHRGSTVRRQHPTVYPDVSKLLRSTEDALTAAGVWRDDARVVEYVRLAKVYVGHPDALPHPGVRILLAPHPDDIEEIQ